MTTSPRLVRLHVAALLAELQQAEPGIVIELVASNQLSNMLRREADIAVRMVRPAQACKPPVATTLARLQ